MRKDSLTPEEQLLKSCDLPANLPLVDVHDAVMEAIHPGYSRPDAKRISAYPQRENTPDIMHKLEPSAEAVHRRKRMPGRRAGMWAASLILVAVLGGVYSILADSPEQAAKLQYEVMPYKPLLATKAGGTIMLAKLPLVISKKPVPEYKESAKQKLQSDKYTEAHEAVKKLLLPGENASFVLKSERDDSLSPQIGIVNPPIYSKDYSSYSVEEQKYAAPHLPEPEYLPAGYAWHTGWIQPQFEIKDKELQAMTGGIKLEGGYRVTWRKEAADSINHDFSALIYKKGEDTVRIAAHHIGAKTGTVATFFWAKTTIVENILINGAELLYMDTTNDEIKLGYKHRLVWADPEQNVYYDLMDSPESSSLSKDEVIRIAAGMMKKDK